jgi:phosphoglycolate phosphatase
MACAAGARAVGVAWGYHDRQELTAAGAHAIAETAHALPRCLEAA